MVDSEDEKEEDEEDEEAESRASSGVEGEDIAMNAPVDGTIMIYARGQGRNGRKEAGTTVVKRSSS